MATSRRPVLLSLALLAAPAVHAQEAWSSDDRTASRELLSLGILLSTSNHPGERFGAHTGFGGEIAYQHLFLLGREPSMFGTFGLGVAAQAEGVDSFSHGRFAASTRLSLGMLGTDLGIASEGSDGLHRSTSYLQISPFLSAGMAWFAFRAAFPIGSDSVYGRELGIVFSFHLPLLFGS